MYDRSKEACHVVSSTVSNLVNQLSVTLSIEVSSNGVRLLSHQADKDKD
jgi:hypothetical protein